LLEFFEPRKVLCVHNSINNNPKLVRLILKNNIPILFSETLAESDVKLMFEFYLDSLKNLKNEQKLFSIHRFTQLDGTFFPKNSPYSHYNISLDFLVDWP
jgi:hypothetical protein